MREDTVPPACEKDRNVPSDSSERESAGKEPAAVPRGSLPPTLVTQLPRTTRDVSIPSREDQHISSRRAGALAVLLAADAS